MKEKNPRKGGSPRGLMFHGMIIYFYRSPSSPSALSTYYTGGGATLELLGGATLPGVAAIQDAK